MAGDPVAPLPQGTRSPSTNAVQARSDPLLVGRARVVDERGARIGGALL